MLGTARLTGQISGAALTLKFLGARRDRVPGPAAAFAFAAGAISQTRLGGVRATRSGQVEP